MGGINCPPPSKIGVIPTELRQEYVVQLATYSGSLFAGCSSFFAANATIESSIVDGDGITLASAEFDSAIAQLSDARLSLGTFQSVWSSVTFGTEISAPDFSGQIDRLGIIVGMIEKVVEAIDAISADTDFQEQIWGNPELTQSLVDAALLLGESISWQSTFALQYADQLVAVA